MNLIDAARPAAERLRSLPRDARVRIVAHYDPDGIASAAIVVQALRTLGRSFHVTYTYEHGDAYYEALQADPCEATLYLDLGANVLGTIARGSGLQIVLDHHAPLGPAPKGEHPDLFVVNPHLLGADGARDACGATVALAFCLAIDESHWSLAAHALVGVWGDRQERDGLHGWNETVLQEGLRRGTLERRVHLALEDAPLMDLLTYPSPVLAPLVTGPAEPLLQQHGLPPQATALELDPAEAETLAGLLVTRLLRTGQPADRVKELFRDVPLSPGHRGLPVPRLASLVAAAAREQDAGLGLALLLGDPDAQRELESLESTYHEKIRTALRRVQLEEVQVRRAFRVFRVHEPAYTGEICGLALERVLPKDRAALAYSVGGPVARASVRATAAHVRQGLHLGVVMERAARAVGGHGGGHAIASGASVPVERFEEFVKAADELAARQMAGTA